jgi:exodeoxyribonuclease-3
MRVISFCAEGIEQAAQRGFFDWMSSQDADIICIQDIRTQEYDLRDDLFFPREYNAYFYDNPDSTNGVAIYCRELPKAIMTGMGFIEFDMEARYIQADYERVSFGSLLAPTATAGDERSIARKAHFFELLYEHLSKIRNKRREFVISGNFQIAHQPHDVQDRPACSGLPGCTPEESRWMDQLLMKLGYVDAFRSAISDEDEFSWWPSGEIGSNGWRVDYQIVSQGLRKTIEYGSYFKNSQYSAHAPLTVDYDYEINPETPPPRY